MISVHSSKAVMVEEVHTIGVPKYKFAYADAVIQLAIGRGKKEGVTSTVSFTYIKNYMYYQIICFTLLPYVCPFVHWEFDPFHFTKYN